MELQVSLPIVEKKIKYLNLIIDKMTKCRNLHKKNKQACQKIQRMGSVCDEIKSIYENINLKKVIIEEKKLQSPDGFHPSFEALEKVADFFNQKVLQQLDFLLSDLLKLKQQKNKEPTCPQFEEIFKNIEFIMQKVERMHERKVFNYMVDHCTNGTVHLHHYHIDKEIEKRYISVQQIVEDSLMKKKMKTFIETNELIVSVSHFTYQMKKGPQRLICELLLSGYFFFIKSHGRRLCHSIQQNPNIDCAIHIWNSLNGMQMLRIFLYLFMPAIKYHRIIRVHKTSVLPITIQDTYQKIRKNTIYDIVDNKEQIISQFYREIPPNFDVFDEQNDKSKTTKLRVICSENVNKNLNAPPCDSQWKWSERIKQKIFGSCLKKKNLKQNPPSSSPLPPTTIENLIFHIHGGGWVAMSSYSHQIYTRTWANQIKNSIIFSIDYKKTPKHPYPEALDECWQAYIWLRLEAEQHFNIKVKKFFIAGDSAGGNLAFGVCLKAQLESFLPPDGLILSYPSLLLDPNAFSPSILQSFDDIIVPITFLEMCIQLYMKNEKLEPRKDPFLSPIIVPDQILALFPPIRMYCGDDDFMIDDSNSFIRKLAHIGADAQLRVYKYLQHGYLNFDIPMAVRLVRKVILETARDVNQMIQMTDKNKQKL